MISYDLQFVIVEGITTSIVFRDLLAQLFSNSSGTQNAITLAARRKLVR